MDPLFKDDRPLSICAWEKYVYIIERLLTGLRKEVGKTKKKDVNDCFGY